MFGRVKERPPFKVKFTKSVDPLFLGNPTFSLPYGLGSDGLFVTEQHWQVVSYDQHERMMVIRAVAERRTTLLGTLAIPEERMLCRVAELNYTNATLRLIWRWTEASASEQP